MANFVSLESIRVGSREELRIAIKKVFPDGNMNVGQARVVILFRLLSRVEKLLRDEKNNQVNRFFSIDQISSSLVLKHGMTDDRLFAVRQSITLYICLTIFICSVV